MSSDLENLRELLDGLSQTDQATQAADEERKEDKRARVYTIKDLLHIETVQAEPLLGPLVRRGQTTIIGGYGGAGKSTMSMEMVRAIVTGQEFLGWEGEGHKALIIDLEQGISIAQRRVY
jgi:RecA-family ATPase